MVKEVTVYHGSPYIVEEPQYGLGNPNNDYGLGFYCTQSLELAKEWACSNNETNGYANIYEIHLDNYKVLDLRKKEYTILNWLALLLKFRTFDINKPIASQAKDFIIKNYLINTDNYDIIIGYRADDSYFSFAKDFINNTITLEQLSKAMQLGDLGTQIVLKSKKAIESLKYIGYERAIHLEYYTKRVNRDKKAREQYFNNYRLNIDYHGTYIIDIIREDKNNDVKSI